MEIIAPDNTALLAQILGDVQQQTYMDTALSVQEEVGEAPQLDIPVFHYFAPSIYMRQMDAPAGAIMVTKMHKTEHFLIVLKGSATILSADGLSHVSAPQIVRTMPGVKRVIYFHEDSTWLTTHPTDETDLDVIEEQLIVPDHQINQFLKSIKG